MSYESYAATVPCSQVYVNDSHHPGHCADVPRGRQRLRWTSSRSHFPRHVRGVHQSWHDGHLLDVV